MRTGVCSTAVDGSSLDIPGLPGSFGRRKANSCNSAEHFQL